MAKTGVITEGPQDQKSHPMTLRLLPMYLLLPFSSVDLGTGAALERT